MKIDNPAFDYDKPLLSLASGECECIHQASSLNRSYLLFPSDLRIFMSQHTVMKLQVLQDGKGKPTGVFVPMEDWTLITTNYPDIENLEAQLPQWEKDIIDSRLDAIAQDPSRIKPINGLVEELRRKI